MANPEKGEVALPVKDGELTLVFPVDAMCQLEGLLKLDSDAIRRRVWVEAERDNTITFLRALFWGALREHHGHITLKQAGEMLPEIERVAAKVIEAFGLSWPPPQELLESKARPRKGAAPRASGTGPAS